MHKRKNKNLFLHCDLDSPRSLLQFWGIQNVSVNLESFFEKSFNRLLELFDEVGMPATLFCVGSEIEESKMLQMKLREAHNAGHELANHTFSHPFGLTQLPTNVWKEEILKCSNSLHKLTGKNPRGFRAPGYAMNENILDFLEEQGFTYDTSAFWSILNPVGQAYHSLFSKKEVFNGFACSSRKIPRKTYYPAPNNWTESGKVRQLVEIPLPRTGLFGLPFYNNFLLSIPSFLSHYLTSNARQEDLVFLLHLIEFVDLSDGIPIELKVHPNVKMPVSKKLQKTRSILMTLKKRYEVLRADLATTTHRLQPITN